MKKLLIVFLFIVSAGQLTAQENQTFKIKDNSDHNNLNNARNQAFVGGLCFIAGGFVWTANQFDFWGKDIDVTVRKTYNAVGVGFMVAGTIFEVIAIEKIIDAQQRRLSLKASPGGVALAFKF